MFDFTQTLFVNLGRKDKMANCISFCIYLRMDGL